MIKHARFIWEGYNHTIRADDDVDVEYLSQLLIFTILVFILSHSEVNKNFSNFNDYRIGLENYVHS